MARKARPGFRFPGPVPKDALRFLRSKDLRPAFSYLDVSAAEHALGFTVAKAVETDLLSDIQRTLGTHLEDGGTLRSFSRELTPILQERGWWGRESVTDPETGETRRVQLGSPRRLKTIFRSNMRSARAAGQWERIQRTHRSHPYLLYRLGPSEEHRVEHVAWDGTLLPWDHPWWHDHMPPGGWGCKCWVRQLSAAEAERLGGVTAAPPRQEVEWRNPRTGVTQMVDRGLDPSWANNPGRDRPRLLAEMLARKLSDSGELAEALGRAQVGRVLDSPLLDRQLDPPPGPALGALAAGWLEPAVRSELRTAQRVAVLGEDAAARMRRVLGRGAASVVRSALPGLLRDPALVLRSAGALELFAREGSQLRRARLQRAGSGEVRLIELRPATRADAEKLLEGGATIVSGSLEALAGG